MAGLKSKTVEHKRWGYRICVSESVYDPSDDTYMVLEYLSTHPYVVKDRRVWDLGCGTGIIGLHALKLGASHVFFTDINPMAAKATLCTLEKNNVVSREDISVCDLDSCFRENFLFDTIIYNPPYLPVECDENWLSHAWCNGPVAIERALSILPGRLASGGTLLMVASTKTGLENIVGGIEKAGLEAMIVSSKSFFYEKLFLLEARRS